MEIPVYKCPCPPMYPDGKQFGEWGGMWGYHFDEHGKWIKAQKCRTCGMKIAKGIECICSVPQPLGQHGGYDIKCPDGVLLLAPCSGTVIRAGWQNDQNHKEGYGLSCVIEVTQLLDMENGTLVKPILTIGHTSLMYLTMGARVIAGQSIGLSGSTGNTNGPHVHLQLELPGPWPRTPIPFKMV